MPVMGKNLNLKLPDRLRARVDACATLVGATTADFARQALRNECERVEKLQGQQARALRAAGADGGDA